MNRQHRRAQKVGGTTFQSCTRDNLTAAAVAADQAGQPGVAELMRQVRSGGLALIFDSDRSVSLTLAELNHAQRPTVAVIGDDDYQSTGPSGWRSTPVLAQWAAAAVIHASGASADTYLEAAKAARILGRAVLIETDTAHADEWALVFKGRPVLLILPQDGKHPVSPPR